MWVETRSIDAGGPRADGADAVPGLEISVVLTLADARGPIAGCVASWTRGQTLARACYEVIVVGTRRQAALEDQVGPVLTAGDRLLRVEAGEELALHDHGARQARGRWLLFTEAHCQAEPACLERLLAYLRAHAGEYVGACLRSLGDGSRHPVAQAEERWYREGAAAWTRDGDWRKVTIRGFAILRDVYIAVGGFEHAFGCFAESALAATLHHRGYRLGYVADAAVTHFNSTTLGELLDYVREYRKGEAAYRTRCDVSYFTRYFGEGGAGRPFARPRAAAACAAGSLAWAVARLPRPGAWRLARAMLRTLASAGGRQVAGPGIEALGARARCAWARLRFALAGRDAEARFRRFSQLWEATGNLARRQALARLPDSGLVPAPGPPALAYAVAEMSAPALCGFHDRETFGGRAFRWSAPMAGLAVRVAPDDYEVVVDTGGLRRFGRSDPLHLYLDGHWVPALTEAAPGALARFAVRREMFRQPASQEVVLACSPLPANRGPDRRRLGAPVFALVFRPARPGDPPPARRPREATTGTREPSESSSSARWSRSGSSRRGPGVC